MAAHLGVLQNSERRGKIIYSIVARVHGTRIMQKIKDHKDILTLGDFLDLMT